MCAPHSKKPRPAPNFEEARKFHAASVNDFFSAPRKVSLENGVGFRQGGLWNSSRQAEGCIGGGGQGRGVLEG